jgi:hypothetical protein
VNETSASLREPLVSEEETVVVTQLVRGHALLEVPGKSSQEVLDPTPEAMTLPDPRLLEDYITAPCKHESNIIK